MSSEKKTGSTEKKTSKVTVETFLSSKGASVNHLFVARKIYGKVEKLESDWLKLFKAKHPNMINK